MTNWQFFKLVLPLYTRYLKRPTVIVLNERNEHLKQYPDAWAYYNPSDKNNIYIMKEHNSIAVRLHEYGHWVNCCLYMILELIWEFIWWGLSIRSLFSRRRKG